MNFQLTGFLSIFTSLILLGEAAYSDQSKDKTEKEYKSVARDLFVVPEGLKIWRGSSRNLRSRSDPQPPVAMLSPLHNSEDT